MFFNYWLSIQNKVNMICVYKEYEVNAKATAKNEVFSEL